MGNPPFAHLAVRTCYSLRHGAIHPDDLAVAVAERGMDAVGITDRGGLYGAVRVAQACAREKVHAIIGADLALEPDAERPGWAITRRGRTRSATPTAQATPTSRTPGPRGGEAGARIAATASHDGAPLRATRHGHRATQAPPTRLGPGAGPAWLEDDAARFGAIARDAAGLVRLTHLVSDHHLGSERGDPHATWDQIGDRAGGWFALLGDDSPVARLADAGRHDAAVAEARRWADHLGAGDVLIGVTHHRAPGDDASARRRLAVADALGLRAVADIAPRYLDPDDAALVDVLDAVRTQTALDPRRTARRNAGGYLATPRHVARTYAERPDLLANATWVAERCDTDLGLTQGHIGAKDRRTPDFAGAGDNAMGELTARCRAGLVTRYDDPGARHGDLLEAELAMIAHLGLAPYFLTVADIVDRIRAMGVLVACRGSAAGSIITYVLRISDVDPVRHDLVFERFMNPTRDELPDIDLDVESTRREEIYRDLLDTYGAERVACVTMVETFKARMAIREVGKALGLPADEIDTIAKAFPHVRAGDVRPALAHLPELAGLNLDRPDLAQLFDLVERLDRFPRHLALHPSGVLLGGRGHLRDLVPVESSAAGFAMAQWDKDDVEALGLCKLDVLAVRMLSSMSHCVDEAARVRGVDIDLGAIGDDDPDTFELIRSTRTLGMFQIESPGQRELVGKFQPDDLGDLVVDISLFRPGPVKGDMIGPFLKRRAEAAAGGRASVRAGQARAVDLHPLVEHALGETHGVIVYHEQVMRCIAAVTGCDLSLADRVRRNLGDTAQLRDLEAWIVDGAISRGMAEDAALSLWHTLAQFASFGFCKAHAASFAVPTYRSAWLKTHYLPELVAGLLTHDPGMYPRRLLLDDARQLGVAALGVDVNASDAVHRVERLEAAAAFAALGVGPAAAEVAARLGCGAAVDGAAWAAATTERLPRGWRWADTHGELLPVAPVHDQLPAARPPVGTRLLPPGGFDLGSDPDRPGKRFAVRLALSDVAGITDACVESITANRPFDSVADLRRRAAVPAPVAEALAHCGAMDDLGGVGPQRSRRDVLLEVIERWSGLSRHRPPDPTAPTQLSLLDRPGDAGLAHYTPSEAVRAELEVVGVETTRHVMRFYDDLLDHLGVTSAVDLLRCRDGQRVRIAGAKVATQTPPVKSGQRIIFLSLDDGTGVGDATFFESVHDRCAWTVFHSWLCVVEGTVHRSGRRGVSINAEAVWDLRRLVRAWREDWLAEAVAEVWGRGSNGLLRPGDGQRQVTEAEADRPRDDGAPSGTQGAPGRDGIRGLGEHRQPHDRTAPTAPSFGQVADPVGDDGDGAPATSASPGDHHHGAYDAANLAAAVARDGGSTPRDRRAGEAAASRAMADHYHGRERTSPGDPPTAETGRWVGAIDPSLPAGDRRDPRTESALIDRYGTSPPPWAGRAAHRPPGRRWSDEAVAAAAPRRPPAPPAGSSAPTTSASPMPAEAASDHDADTRSTGHTPHRHRDDDDPGPPRKLWHASSGSAG